MPTSIGSRVDLREAAWHAEISVEFDGLALGIRSLIRPEVDQFRWELWPGPAIASQLDRNIEAEAFLLVESVLGARLTPARTRSSR